MIGKIINGIAQAFIAFLLLVITMATAWGIHDLVSELFAPSGNQLYYPEEWTWVQQHHNGLGQAAGIIYLVGVLSLLYVAYRDRWELNKLSKQATCDSSCPCPKHSWNKSTGNVTGTKSGQPAGRIIIAANHVEQ